MLPSQGHPERGRFVRDQVAALRALRELGGSQAGGCEALAELDVELYEFAPGARALARAARELRRRYRGERFDVVHAHFGLTAWPALAVGARARGVTLHGTDLSHPRTRLATWAALPFMDLLAAASQPLIEQIPGRRARARTLALPCGVDIARFVPTPRTEARAALDLRLDAPLGLGPDAPAPHSRSRAAIELPADAPLLLFPADPARPEKRYDRARALADAAGARLLTLGGVAPERVPLYVNAANAVIVPSEREGFGLAVLEALACDVPVLATPVGIHPQALDGLAGTLCARFDLAGWAAALTPHLACPDPRVAGRTRAERFSARRMAERVADAWCALIADAG
jgi:glycosyltransferase involved in cell wall biosynthesis